jgi:hypothetical protein
VRALWPFSDDDFDNDIPVHVAGSGVVIVPWVTDELQPPSSMAGVMCTGAGASGSPEETFVSVTVWTGAPDALGTRMLSFRRTGRSGVGPVWLEVFSITAGPYVAAVGARIAATTTAHESSSFLTEKA